MASVVLTGWHSMITKNDMQPGIGGILWLWMAMRSPEYMLFYGLCFVRYGAFVMTHSPERAA